MSTACCLEAVRVGVPDVAGALPLYRDLLGGREVATGVLAFPGGVRIELRGGSRAASRTARGAVARPGPAGA